VSSEYTFGDTELAAQRLDVVADAFDPVTREFLIEDLDPNPEVVLDLGCGPGRTTRLLVDVLHPQRVVGVDASESFLEIARRRVPEAEFVVHDVTAGLPVAHPDLIFCRLLLAHLADPESVVSRWLEGGGVVAADEVEFIDSRNPVLRTYETIVVALVASRGALMYAGPRIAALPGVRSSRVREIDVCTSDAARMFLMNLRTWRTDPFIVDNYPAEEIDELAAALEELTTSEATGEIDWGLRQVVIGSR
jgi:trans-aconitate 2-methyltransferase